MSEPARHIPFHDAPGRSSTQSGPLRDWLAAMRATAPEPHHAEPETAPAAAAPAEPRHTSWAPRLVVPAETPAAQDDEVAELIAENMMLKAKLRLELDRRDEFHLLLAQEIRELRAHVADEIGKFEDLRGERDLWKARCEALMQPLFTGQAR